MNILKAYSHFDSENDARSFVEECEKNFEKRLNAIAKRVGEDRGIRIVALSGPSCSGKTTTAKKMISEFEKIGRRVHVVSIDDFYYDREYLNERAAKDPNIKVDYDSVSTIDINALAECVKEIFSDGKTTIPKYDFSLGKRIGYTEFEPFDEDLFIFEGIQAIYPEITALFEAYPSASVYICVESGIAINGIVFEPNEIRMLRRIVRDYHFRSVTPSFTMYVWESVRANEDKNIFPYVSDCNMHIDSAMAFEINLLKPYLEKILADIAPDSEFIESARSIIEKIKDIQPISKDYLSKNSLYYEFI